jgi:hypothetical protein
VLVEATGRGGCELRSSIVQDRWSGRRPGLPDVAKWTEAFAVLYLITCSSLLEGSDNYNKVCCLTRFVSVLLCVWERGWLSIALIRRSRLSLPLTIL